jgi:hypothetical protein
VVVFLQDAIASKEAAISKVNFLNPVLRYIDNFLVFWHKVIVKLCDEFGR